MNWLRNWRERMPQRRRSFKICSIHLDSSKTTNWIERRIPAEFGILLCRVTLLAKLRMTVQVRLNCSASVCVPAQRCPPQGCSVQRETERETASQPARQTDRQTDRQTSLGQKAMTLVFCENKIETCVVQTGEILDCFHVLCLWNLPIIAACSGGAHQTVAV